ncbi:TonB-linked outer membrane protein, SusC/RagA family [Arachidicoccus rhizosphaerae]|uniref:TonB-linked outer membrane protein, SusC/RagA family n=1 Tax=Arachidicoccus rhizosphaerae TaxID=551991 RepID=A0A1H3VRF6_9BACT|nr:TonB-dependent receptor [Arachidicoccus rhizosphaerae]SDZ77340.1 TonB-linked outer membrane protein, SusC/RagA family [Arachidicoccus rhizosphaerae]
MELKKLKCRWRITLLLSFGFFLTATGLQAQNETTQQETINLTGNIKDNLGTNLEGVTVRDITSGKTVISDADGNYKIEASKGDSLIASYIGYQDYRWQFSDRIIVNIVLEPISGGLNDVAVVGYGRQKKISLVGAQATVKVEELKQPVANLNTMLAGRISGLVGVQRSGLPGSNSADIWIRGISTFGSSGSGPLVIIDGVQGRNTNDLDPEDVEDFTILKDATATAVYGALGANGVIIINTKRGSASKVNLMANYLEGVTAFTKVPEMADAETYMNLRNEAMVASGFTPAYSQDYIDSTLDPNANHYVYPNVDWMKTLFNNLSHNRRFNFSARGGSDNVQFYTSLAYYEESSLLKTDGLQNYDAGTKYQRYNFVSNVDMKWTKTTKFSLGINGYISQLNEPGSGATSAFSNAMSVSPVRYPVMYPGNLVSGIAEGSTPSPNPWADITQTGYKEAFQSKIATTAQVKQDFDFITKGLSANVLYSFDTYSNNNQYRKRQRSVYYLNQSDPYNDDGSLNLEQVISGVDVLSYDKDYSQDRQFSLQGQVNWARNFGDHHVQAMVVYSQLSQPNPTADSYQDAIPTRQQNYAARATYSYLDKYFAEFDAGYTGSQVFSPENRYGFFPSLGVGWVLSNEKWWKPLSNVFNFFKIRYSNGFSGAIGGSRFDYITTITDGAKGTNFGRVGSSVNYSGINILHYGANVKWAKSHDQDVGLEFNVLNNKLTFIVDWFQKYRTGIFLTRANFPAFAGLQYQPDGNYGTTINRGFDATVELLPIPLTDKLSISFRGTFTYNKDKLLENSAAPYEEPYMDPRGQKILTNYGYIAEGLFQSEADIANHADQSGVGGIPRVGDIMYKDLNGDGLINVYDKTYIGHGDVAPLTFGLATNIQYGNWYVSAFFEGVQGADRELTGNARSPFSGSDDNNIFANAVDRWTEDNHATNPFYPRLAYGTVPNANNNVTSTWWIKDISFIRFKTLNIGYNLPNKIFKNTGFKNATIYFDAVNLCYWSPFKLWDPEMNTGNGNTYPNTRNMAIGFKVNFD